MSSFLASVTLKGTKIGGFILKNPMSKNGLVKNSVSRNQVVPGNPAMHTDEGAPVINNDDTMTAERGGADAERDIRGFALKFYTEEGNWDMVENNTPVFFLRDPKHFIDLNRAIKRDPKTNMHSSNTNWDFWTSLPESLHQVTITMSDREAAQVIAEDRESHQRDLFDAIEFGQYPKWTLYFQIMTEEEAKQVDFNLFDLTKVWPK